MCPVGAAQNTQAAASDLTQHITSCLVLGNQEEIALAEIAQTHAEHPKVKKFDAHMIEQHQQAVTKLEQAVPQVAGITLGATSGQSSQQRLAAGKRGNQSPELELNRPTAATH